MVRSCLQHLEWRSVCAQLDARLVSPLAKHGDGGGEGWLARSTDPDAVACRFAEQDGLEMAQRWRPELETELGAQLRRVQPLGDGLAHAARGVMLDAADLWAVGELADALTRLAPLCEPPDDAIWAHADERARAGHAALARALAGLRPQAELARALGRSIVLEGPADEAVVADAASPALARAREQVRTARQALVRGADRLVRQSDLSDALADRYYTEREGRVVLPVRSDSFSRAGGRGTVTGIIHGASTSGQTLYVEPPALVDDNNRLREAQMAARAEERKVLAALSAQVGAQADALAAGLHAMLQLDRIRARLRLGDALEGRAPAVLRPEQAERLELPSARHPLMVLAGTEVVPNDLFVQVGGGLVISGPNAGGKTVALKTLGLCVLMTQAGLRLPTSEPGAVPLYRAVITDVGDDQSISANLSTFSAHIGHVIEALEHARTDPAGTLVLLDEVAVGTDPEQGAALAEAILCTLVERGATVVATTHYERLKLLAHRGHEGAPGRGRFANAAVGFELQELRPTFLLHLGVPGSSSAIAVARRLGVDGAVLEAAEAMLSDERLRVDVLLQALESERVALQQQREALQARERELSAREARIAARERRELEQAQTRRAKAHDAAASELRALEDELRRRRKQLRATDPQRSGDGRAVDPDARQFAARARQAVAQGRLPSEPTPGQAPDHLEPGDRVFVESLGAEGEVLAVKGDRITVQLPLAKTTVDRAALRPRSGAPRRAPAAAPAPRPSQARRHFGADAIPVTRRLDNYVDLRGQRAEDALPLLEVFLDRAIGDDQEVVLVCHGHGSGALRRAVREHLPHLRHVAAHRPGLPPEGGDAVTVVWVRA